MIAMEDVSFSYGRAPFMRGLSCAMADGRITALLGPNGSGKSTCLKLCAGILRPTAGKISLNGSDIRDFSPRDLAKQLAFLPQSRPQPMITVRSLVCSGRYPYMGIVRRMRADDAAAVDWALEATGMAALAERELRSLSGGERQKAYLAMLIAQGAHTLLLDEPTTYLDIGRQLELMALLDTLKRSGKCIVMVLHDVDMATEFCDDAIVMQRGAIIYTGEASALVQSGAITRAYSVYPIENAGLRFKKI